MSVETPEDDTQTAADHGLSMTRRGLFAAAGAATVGYAGLQAAPRYSPIGRARAVAPAVAIGIVAGGAAIGYIGGKAVDAYVGDDRDYSGYTGASALKTEIYAGAVEMVSADERVMTSIENNISRSDNVAYAKGKAALVEAMNDGATESEANTAMQDAIDEYYSSIQENILNHYSQQMSQMHHHMDRLSSHSNTEIHNAIHWWDSEAGGWDDSNMTSPPPLETVSVTCLDGRTVDVKGFDAGPQTAFGPDLRWPPDTRENGGQMRYVDPDASNYLPYPLYRSVDAFDAAVSRRDSVNAALTGFTSDVYNYYEPGDIPTEDLVDPVTAATEMNQDYEDRGFRSAQAAILGIPTNAEFSADLEIVSEEAEDGVWQVNADIFTAHVPTVDVAADASISSGVLTLSKEPVANSTYSLTTTDSETVEFSAGDLTDNGGGSWEIDLSADLSTVNTSVDVLLEEDEFRVGETYQPSGWSEPFFIAYAYNDSVTGELRTQFTQIESEFTIVKVTDTLGNEVESFSNDSQNTQTSDIETLEEELAMIREAQIRQQKEAEEETSDGDGGGFFDFGPEVPGVGLILAGAAVLFAIGSQNN